MTQDLEALRYIVGQCRSTGNARKIGFDMPLHNLAQALEFGLNVLLQATGQHGLRVSDLATSSLI